MKPKLITRLLAGAFLVASTAVSAAGMGRLTVLSGIGQPLRAEIDLVSVQKDELGTLSARVASPDAYQQVGIEYNAALPSVKLVIDKRPGGQPFILITSTQPVSEPYLDLLVELTSATGKLSREYAVLMDPVGAPTAAAATLAQGKQPAEPAKPVEKTAPRREVAEVVAAAGASGESYGPIKAGETLSGIARANKSGDVNLDQMLVALFKSNPQAFAGKNMNRLRTGAILRMPDASELSATSAADASKEVKLQAANWHAYRQQLAASAPAAPDKSPQQDVSGRVSASVEGNIAGRSADDVLRLSKADGGGAIKTATGGGGKVTKAALDRVRAMEEELTARDKALQEANERVQMLEKSVSDMQRLLEIKSAGGAQMQNESAAKAQATAAPAPAEPLAEASAPAAAKAPESTAAVAPANEAARPEPQAAPAPKPEVAVSPPVSEASLLESVTSEPLYLAGGAGGLALLGALAFVRMRRRPKQEAIPEHDVLPAHESLSAAVIEPAPIVAVAPISPAPSDEMGALEEATKYLALGRDAQAEEVLKEALKSQSGQPALLLKLLEVFAGRKDKRAFQSTAQELFAVTGGSGEMWLQAAQMGHTLDPENPVFATATSGNAGTATDLDFDLDAAAPKGMTETDITVDAGQTARELERTQMMGEEDARHAVTASGVHTGVAVSAVAAGTLTTTDFNLDDVEPAANSASTGFTGSKTEAGPLDINFDLPPEVLSTSVGNQTGSEIKVDLQRPAATPTSSDILDFDLSGISLDLDATSTGVQAAAATPLKNDHWFDVQTKFDLAKAYQEMGDKESAREILKEVISEGDAQQQAEAKTLLEALA